MKTRLLKRLRKRANREYFIKIKSNKYVWVIALVHQSHIGANLYYNEIASYSGQTGDVDEFNNRSQQLTDSCNKFRCIYMKYLIDELKNRNLKTRKLY